MGETFEPTQIHLVKGDVIQSKKGFLQHSGLTDKFYCVKKAEYMGNGLFRAIQKEEIEVTEVSKDV